MIADLGPVLRGRRAALVILGEALQTLSAFPSESCHGAISDPPYSSGGQFRSDRVQSVGKKYGLSTANPAFTGDSRDQRAFLAWASLWIAQLYRVCVPGSPICLFTDWRQLPTMTDALQAGGWVWRGIVPWIKPAGAARPQPGRFHQRAEFVVWGSKGPLALDRLGGEILPGELRGEVLRGRGKVHPTQKPEEVLEQLVEIVEPRGIILDPFAGSGSTLRAALRRGRRAVGIELVPHYADLCREAIDPASRPERAA